MPGVIEEWDSYLGWCESLNGDKEHPVLKFLEEQIETLGIPKNEISILDVAAATGMISISLTNRGFNVTANEVNDSFRKKITENIEIFKGNIGHVTNYNWLLLSHYFGRDKFHMVMMLGNAFSVMLSDRDREKCIEEFIKVLKPGGILILDIRNYEWIRGHTQSISHDNFKERNTPFYTGSRVSIYPSEIKDDKVELTLTKGERMLGKIQTYPMKEGELYSLLKSKCMKSIRRYNDYDSGVYPSKLGSLSRDSLLLPI